MLSSIISAGYATVTVDFTNDLSSLLVGLIGMTAIAAAMIVVEITRHRAAQDTPAVANPVSTTVAYLQAA